MNKNSTQKIKSTQDKAIEDIITSKEADIDFKIGEKLQVVEPKEEN